MNGCLQELNDDNLKDEKNNSNQLKTIYVSNLNNADYKQIQDAINAANNGDTIIVQNGTYHETLTINTSINLVGMDKNNTIIKCTNINEKNQLTVIMINADNCSIEDLTISKSCDKENVIGVKINSSSNNIYNMTISNFSEGFYLDKYSENNSISSCNIINNIYGIYVDDSYNNNFSNNFISQNKLYGIYLQSSSNYNTVSHNCISLNDHGIRIKGAKYNNISSNIIINNKKGIYCCCSGYYNYIIYNTFKNNSDFNAAESSGLRNGNYWNTDSPPYVGNYWDNYTGVDDNNDGIGDIPYIVPNNDNKDNYPLMVPIDKSICNLK